MKIMNNIQNENSVKPITEEKQVNLKGGKKTPVQSSYTMGLSSPPRWKDR